MLYRLKIWKNLYKVFVIDFKEESSLQYIEINKFIAMLGNTYKKYKSKIFRGYWKNGISKMAIYVIKFMHSFQSFTECLSYLIVW